MFLFSLYFIFAFVHVVFFAPLPPDGSYLLHQTGPKLFFDPHKHPEMWNIGQGEDWEIKGRIYLEQNKIFRWQLVLVFMIVIRKEMLNNDTQTRNLWKNCLTNCILKNYVGRKRIPGLAPNSTFENIAYWDDNRDMGNTYTCQKSEKVAIEKVTYWLSDIKHHPGLLIFSRRQNCIFWQFRCLTSWHILSDGLIKSQEEDKD